MFRRLIQSFNAGRLAQHAVYAGVATAGASALAFGASATSFAGGLPLSVLQDLSAPAAAGDGSAGRSSRYSTLGDMIEDVFPSVCKVEGTRNGQRLSSGSGFVIDESGIIVTNHHVLAGAAIAGSQEVEARFDDGRVYRLRPIAADAESDIAVARLIAPAGTKFKPIRLPHIREADDSGLVSRMKRGEPLVVLGAPLGGSIAPTVGILSGVRFVGDDELMSYVLGSRADWELVQVDAAMSSGSSGGPVVSKDGELIGISVMVRTSGTPMEVGAVNYAVAADQAVPIIRSLLTTGRVIRPSVGLTLLPVDLLADGRERLEARTALLPASGPDASTSAASGSGGDGRYVAGALVTGVRQGFPAEKAGLQRGDVIVAINGRRMSRLGEYFAAVGPVYSPERRLVCTVFRPYPGAASTGSVISSGKPEGQIFTVTITPVPKPDEGGRRGLFGGHDDGYGAGGGLFGRRRRSPHSFGPTGGEGAFPPFA